MIHYMGNIDKEKHYSAYVRRRIREYFIGKVAPML